MNCDSDRSCLWEVLGIGHRESNDELKRLAESAPQETRGLAKCAGAATNASPSVARMRESIAPLRSPRHPKANRKGAIQTREKNQKNKNECGSLKHGPRKRPRAWDS